MDIYAALMGEPPTEQEKLEAIARRLAAQRQIGLVAQMTGDRVSAPVGKQLLEGADTQAENMGQRGEQARYRRYQEGASQRSNELLNRTQNWRESDAVAERKHEIALELLRQRGDMAMQGMKGTDKKYRNMTVKQVEDLTNQASEFTSFTGLSGKWKDNYAGIVRGVPLRRLTNTAATLGLGTDNSQDAAKWWADFNNLYTLPERNRLFGATLTDNEQAEWNRNAISPDMSPEQIKERLQALMVIYNRKRSSLPRNLKAAKYDPELIDTIFSDPTSEASAPAGTPSFEEWKKANGR